MSASRRSERGSSMVEFALAGLPCVFIMVTIAQLSLTLWTYHTLSSAVREAARYASTKGPGCSYNGNTCASTVGAVASRIANAATGLQASHLTVSVSSPSGTITCNPLSSCFSSTTQWPPQSLTLPAKISISGSYPVQLVFLLFVGSSRSTPGTVTAVTQQSIQF